MKSWTDLIADVDLILNKHFSPGRGGKNIDKIVIHHNAGNLSIQGIYDVWQQRQASAHYQVDQNGMIGQLVNDWDTAWHAGDWETNLTSIGVEHANLWDGTIPQATVNEGAKLVGALCAAKGLGRPQWKVNVFPHFAFSSTACPGALAGRQNAEYMAKAQAFYDELVSGKVSTPTPAPAPAPTRSKKVLPANYPLPYPLPVGHYFGPIDGPEASHGGFYTNERPWVKAIQQALAVAGFTPNGAADVGNGWSDGVYEQPTVDAVVAFQKKCRPNSTDRWGEMWADDLETLANLFF